jgi:DNA-binding PadR family transcriptional regulator
LIRKIPTTRYYRVTDKGHRLMTLVLKLRETDLTQVTA